jgi:hypothetical protein
VELPADALLVEVHLDLGVAADLWFRGPDAKDDPVPRALALPK